MPRVTKTNAVKYLQNAMELFAKVTGESVGATFTWNGQVNVLGAEPFRNFAEKHQDEICQSLVPSIHQQGQAGESLANPCQDEIFCKLISDGKISSLNVLTLRRLVVWITQRTIGKKRHFWGNSDFKPEWWPREFPFRNVRNSRSDCLVAIIEAYRCFQQVPRIQIRDRSPLTSPEIKSEPIEENVISTGPKYFFQF